MKPLENLWIGNGVGIHACPGSRVASLIIQISVQDPNYRQPDSETAYSPPFTTDTRVQAVFLLALICAR